MKILQVFDWFSPVSGGGTVALIYHLSRVLAQRGHEVVIYTSDFELDREYIGSLHGVEVHPFACWSRVAAFYLVPGVIGEARKKLRDFDIIHLHCYRSFQNIVIHHYALKYNVPYVLDAHGSATRAPGGKRGFKWLLKWLFDVIFGYRILRDASRVIAETEVGIKEYMALGVNQGKIVRLHPLVSVGEYAQLPPPGLFRHKFNIGEDRHIIMFLGRIHRVKGLDFLVESFYQLAKDRNDVILVIVGQDDGYKSNLERLINGLDLSGRVLFAGFLGGNDKLSALVDADVVVQTSITEQGAGVPLEAVLCNTPVIVSSHTGAGEEVKKIDAGYLVQYGNKIDLRGTLQYVLDNPVEARDKTRKAKEYIKANLSLEKCVPQYEQLYTGSIAARKTGSQDNGT